MTNQQIAEKVSQINQESFIVDFEEALGFNLLSYRQHSAGAEATFAIADYLQMSYEVRMALKTKAAQLWGIPVEKVSVGAYPQITPSAVVFYAVVTDR